MRDVAGKTVLITGGAKGMGRLWALRFAHDKARIALWDLDAEALAQTAAELKAMEVEVVTDVVDVGKPERIREAAAKLQEATGGVDVLVNNAGIVFSAPFVETPDEKLAATIQINLTGLMLVMKAFLPRMIEKGVGHIVNISSASGFIGVPRMPAYCASKWGIIGLTESVRLEMKLSGHKGIKFTLVCPSYVNTGMFEGAKPAKLTKLLTPERMVEIAYDRFKADSYWVREPWLVKLTPWLKGSLPTPWFDSITGMFGVTRSMDDWKGH